MMDPTKTITVDPPLECTGGKFDELKLREPTIGEWQKAETHKTDNQRFVALITTISGWPEPAVKMLPVSKFNEAMAYLGPFLFAGLGTGETSE